MQAAEDHRRSDRELAARRAIFAARGAFGLRDLIQYASARLHVRTTRVRQGEPARRAHEEPRAQVRLQVRNLAAHGRERHAEAPRSRRKAAGFRRRYDE